MIKRSFWINKIKTAWNKRSIVWLSGIRRVGKTCLSQSFAKAEYFDCELPRVRWTMDDPEAFFRSLDKRTIILDEIHRLNNPSQLLKIAADHFPKLKILATGSSTLGASAKFRDTLTGRKTEIWLTPMTVQDLCDFNKTDLTHRLLFGGLPSFLLAKQFPERDFQEWMDAYWAKDIQELFRLERRQSFLRFTELLMTQSGGIFEATRFSATCEVSRPTITNYLSALEATFVMHIVRPFSSRRSNEIISAPKVYAMDTGFVAYHKGWHKLRKEDFGYLWEHFVLNEMHAYLQMRQINYWRNKQGHEVDFVLTRRGQHPAAIECKWSAADFDPSNLLAFRRVHPRGHNFVVCHDIVTPITRQYQELSISFVNIDALIKHISIK